MAAYYNEFDEYAAAWLRNLIAAGLIAPGEVDTRSIVDVRPDDLRGFTQCHFFAGIGVWSHSIRASGIGDDLLVWSASTPCQPWSDGGAVHGRNKGEDDERDLWPSMFNLVRECRPGKLFGEQVASTAALRWIDRLHNDLESCGYTIRSAITEAGAFGSPQRRKRYYFAADLGGSGVARPFAPGGPRAPRPRGWRGEADLREICDGPFRAGASWPQPLLRRLDDGYSGSVDQLHALGNALDARQARAFIEAVMESMP